MGAVCRACKSAFRGAKKRRPRKIFRKLLPYCRFGEVYNLGCARNASYASAFGDLLFGIVYFPGLVWNNPIWGSGMEGRFLASAAAFVFNYACYFAEIYRGGIQSVPKGQQEAGQVLGMTKSQIFFKVTLLQMIKRILPPISNEIITLVKDTSLARVVALQEIIWMGEEFLKGSRGIAGAIWPLFFTGAYYLVFSGILTALLNRAERRLDFFKA